MCLEDDDQSRNHADVAQHSAEAQVLPGRVKRLDSQPGRKFGMDPAEQRVVDHRQDSPEDSTDPKCICSGD